MSSKKADKSSKKTKTTKARTLKKPVQASAEILSSVTPMKKNDCIRLYPVDMPAKQVMAKALEEHGLEISEQSVYATRMADRKKAMGSRSDAIDKKHHAQTRAAEALSNLIDQANPGMQALAQIGQVLSPFTRDQGIHILKTAINLAELA